MIIYLIRKLHPAKVYLLLTYFFVSGIYTHVIYHLYMNNLLWLQPAYVLVAPVCCARRPAMCLHQISTNV